MNYKIKKEKTVERIKYDTRYFVSTSPDSTRGFVTRSAQTDEALMLFRQVN